MPARKQTLLIVTIGLLLFALLISGGCDDSSTASPDFVDVDALALKQSYIKNQIAADEKYNDKIMVLRPMAVREIGRMIDGTAYIMVGGVQCAFTTNESQIKYIKRGDYVVVQGTCRGFKVASNGQTKSIADFLYFDHCSIVQQ